MIPKRTLARVDIGLACALIAACTDTHPMADADVAPIPYEVTIAVPGADGGFVGFAAGDVLPMHLGFQGFVFASIVFVAHGDAPGVTPARSTLAIEGEAPIAQNYARIDFGHESNGSRYSSPVLVFANDILLRSGQRRSFELRVVLSDGRYVASSSIEGAIGFDATCIDDGDGGCAVADAEVDSASRVVDAAGELDTAPTSVDARLDGEEAQP
jgi:hypothetical protein